MFFFTGSVESVVNKNAWAINLKASGRVPDFKNRDILAKAVPS